MRTPIEPMVFRKFKDYLKHYGLSVTGIGGRDGYVYEVNATVSWNAYSLSDVERIKAHQLRRYGVREVRWDGRTPDVRFIGKMFDGISL